MTAYSLPSLMVGWIVGAITVKLGKKRTAYGSLIIGMALLACMTLVQSSFLITIILIFFASMFVSIALPTVNGVYADLITEKAQYEHEVESLSDFYTNLGFVIGPISAGIMADAFGNAGAFSIVGIVGLIIALFLYRIAPEKIHI
jgi:MFS family permease